MNEKIWERYSTYPKKKEKKHIRRNNLKFLQKSYEWLSWKMESVGGLLFHAPYVKA